MIQKMLAIYLWFLCLRACHSAGGCGRCAIARPRGATPRPRSGAAAESTRLWRRSNGREEHPAFEVGGRLRGDTQRPRSGAVTRRNYPMPLSTRPGAMARRSYPTPLRRRPGEAAERSNPCLRPGVATRGVTPHLRSGAAAGRSYPMTPCPRPGAAAGRSNPRPRPGAATRRVTQSRGGAGARGPRGAIPH